MKKWFSDIRRNTASAILPTIVAAVIFFVTWQLFGMENSMIAPFATLSYLRLRQMNHYQGCIVRQFVVYGIMTCAAFAAVINVPLCILVNAAGLFWMAYYLIDEYQPTNYFPAGMALIFFQISPITGLPALGRRLLALLLSFLIVYAFVLLSSAGKAKRHPIQEKVSENFGLAEQMLDAYETGSADRLSELREQIRDNNFACSMDIYSYTRSSILPRGRVSWYCQFVLLFQILDYLLLEPGREENYHKARSLFQTFYSRFENTVPTADYKRLNFRYNHPDLRNMRLRFALRMVLVMTPCLTFCLCMPFTNVYWLCISVFFMMIPFSDETASRIRQRVIGSIIGILICLVLFTLVPSLYGRIIIMLIANFFIYASNGYSSTVVFITCSALALNSLEGAVTVMLAQRLIYTLIGAAIAIFANHCIFPVRVRKQIDYMMEILGRIRNSLLLLRGGSVPGNNDSGGTPVFLTFGRKRIVQGELDEECLYHQGDQLIIKSYLLTHRIRVLNSLLPEADRDPELRKHLSEHMMFVSSYMSTYFHGSPGGSEGSSRAGNQR